MGRLVLILSSLVLAGSVATAQQPGAKRLDRCAQEAQRQDLTEINKAASRRRGAQRP